jgi:hypothetical protein
MQQQHIALVGVEVCEERGDPRDLTRGIQAGERALHIVDNVTGISGLQPRERSEQAPLGARLVTHQVGGDAKQPWPCVVDPLVECGPSLERDGKRL